VDQTGESPKGQGQDYVGNAPLPKSIVSKGFRQGGQQCEDGHCCVKHNVADSSPSLL